MRSVVLYTLVPWLIALAAQLLAPAAFAAKRAQETDAAILRRALALYDQGRPDESEALLERLVRKDPGKAVFWYNLGNTLGEQGRFSEAIEAFRHAIALAPSLLPAQANLGRALFVTGDVDGAIHAYEAALAIDPQNVRVRAMLDDARKKKATRP